MIYATVNGVHKLPSLYLLILSSGNICAPLRLTGRVMCMQYSESKFRIDSISGPVVDNYGKCSAESPIIYRNNSTGLIRRHYVTVCLHLVFGVDAERTLRYRRSIWRYVIVLISVLKRSSLFRGFAFVNQGTMCRMIFILA